MKILVSCTGFFVTSLFLYHRSIESSKVECPCVVLLKVRHLMILLSSKRDEFRIYLDSRSIIRDKVIDETPAKRHYTEV